MSATAQRPKARRAWATPKVVCLETRPEVTAYSGDVNPWTVR